MLSLAQAYTHTHTHTVTHNTVNYECIIPGDQLALVANLCTMEPNIYGSSVWTFLSVTLVAQTI
jgi:hypothetical protein